jgi:hypothetical protein
VIPIRESDNGVVWRRSQPCERAFPDVFLTIVIIVQVFLRIFWILDDQRSTQAITVLVPKVTVIPVCALKSKEVSLLIPYDMSKRKNRLFLD